MRSDKRVHLRVQEAARRLWDRMTGWVSARIRRLLAGAVIGVVVLALGSVATVQFTSRSRFCVTCHYMRPYYSSWQASSHNFVPCIDCHYPPGLQSELQRKFQASVQLVKYVTKQYGTRPWTEIDDASCLRSGCHAKRLLAGKVDFHGIAFDHGPHLTQFRRVTRLRCTSCHSQIVQGTHMTATPATCFLCHFKRIPAEQAMAECTLCHKPPLPATTPAAKAAHELIDERSVRCVECHAGVVQGEGRVPQSWCLVCHAEEERLKQYGNIEAMHANHVTKHKVECTRCHQEILHKRPSADLHGGLDCQSCHPDHHAGVRRLYAGTGEPGAEPTPDPMFNAGVTCVSCHRTHGQTPGGPVLRGGAAGCMNCHGEKYGRTLAQWQMEIRGRLAQLEPALANARKIAANARVSREDKSRALALCDSAEERLLLVKHGNGVHNPEYARQTLAAAADDIAEALSLLGSTARVPGAPAWPEPSPCMDCHAGPPVGPLRVYGVTFEHEPHTRATKGDCRRCHPANGPDAPDHGKMKLSAGECRACHQGRLASRHPGDWRTAHGAESRKDRASCRVCHTDESCNDCHGIPIPHPNGWGAAHGEPAKKRGAAACATCHAARYCTECHKISMPHPDAWLMKEHGATFRNQPSSCRNCHPTDHCKVCHSGIEMPHPRGWLDKHGAPSKGAPGGCAVCHAPDMCRKCHRRAPLDSHDAQWPKTHTKTAEDETDFCALCHGQDPCAKCHGVKLPHPENFALQHNEQASFAADSPCYKCHDKQEMCGLCHQFEQ